MDKIIFAATEIMVQPIIDEMVVQYEAALRAENSQPGSLTRKSEESIKKEAKDACEEFKHWMIGEEEINRLEKGFATIIEQLGRVSNRDQIIEEINAASNKLISSLDEEVVDDEAPELPIYDTLQEMYGMSDETFQSMYQIGSELYREGKTEEALNVFIFLTNLNSLVFESWLALGTSWLIKNNYIEALRGFSVASLLNFDHPEPHLYSAECYLMINQMDIAKQTFDIALSLMSDEQKAAFADHIQYIKKQLNIK